MMMLRSKSMGGRRVVVGMVVAAKVMSDCVRVWG